MVSHPTPGIPLQSEHSLPVDKNGLGFIALSLVGENKIISWGKQLRQVNLFRLLETRQND
jgi:hypothetical protein